MYIDNEATFVTNTQIDLGSFLIAPGESLNMFAWGMSEGDTVSFYPDNTSALMFEAVAGPTGSVNFSLPSGMPHSFFAVFSGNLALVIDSTLGHEAKGGIAAGEYLPLAGGTMSGAINMALRDINLANNLNAINVVATNAEIENIVTGNGEVLMDFSISGQIRIKDATTGDLVASYSPSGNDKWTFFKPVSMNMQYRIESVLDPVDAQDAATKAYVDANAGGDFLPLDGSLPMTGQLMVDTIRPNPTKSLFLYDSTGAIRFLADETGVSLNVTFGAEAALFTDTEIKLSIAQNVKFTLTATHMMLSNLVIQGVVDPVNPQDAATKAYVDIVKAELADTQDQLTIALSAIADLQISVAALTP